MAQHQAGRNVQPRDMRIDMEHAAWIAGRIEVLLSHYFQPETPMEVREAAIDDWVEALSSRSRHAIEHACSSWLRDQPRRRPTPGDIMAKSRGYASDTEGMGKGDRTGLSRDELYCLETRVIPHARRWLGIPGLRKHGEATLEYWGERP